jgi:hypothetical protein
MVLRPNAGHGFLILKVSRSRSNASESVGILWTSDQLVKETPPWQHTTNNHAPGEIRTYNFTRQAAVDLCLSPRGHW